MGWESKVFLGLWLNRDPLATMQPEGLDGPELLHVMLNGYGELLPEGPGLYGYGNNNPILFSDPDGRAIIIAPIVLKGAKLGGISGALSGIFSGLLGDECADGSILGRALRGGIGGAIGGALGGGIGGPFGGAIGGGTGALIGGGDGLDVFVGGTMSGILGALNPHRLVSTSIGLGGGGLWSSIRCASEQGGNHNGNPGSSNTRPVWNSPSIGGPFPNPGDLPL